VILKKDIILVLRDKFPAMRNTYDYADVILEAISLKASNYSSAKNRRDFLRSGKIKISSFSSSYTKYNLLIAIKNADTNTII